MRQPGPARCVVMTHRGEQDKVGDVARRAIGGDPSAVAWVTARADVTEDPTLIALAVLLGSPTDRLALAAAVAATRRDRQTVAIARAHLAGDRDLVDALARDHLVDFPDSYLVAWIASGAVVTVTGS
jgi:hypothetical protein